MRFLIFAYLALIPICWIWDDFESPKELFVNMFDFVKLLYSQFAAIFCMIFGCTDSPVCSVCFADNGSVRGCKPVFVDWCLDLFIIFGYPLIILYLLVSPYFEKENLNDTRSEPIAHESFRHPSWIAWAGLLLLVITLGIIQFMSSPPLWFQALLGVLGVALGAFMWRQSSR